MINLTHLLERSPRSVGQAANEEAQKKISARDVVLPAALIGTATLTAACAPGEATPAVVPVAKPEAPAAKEAAAATPTALVTKEGKTVTITSADFAQFIGVITIEQISKAIDATLANTLAISRGAKAQGITVLIEEEIVTVSADGIANYSFIPALKSDGTVVIAGFDPNKEYVGYFGLTDATDTTAPGDEKIEIVEVTATKKPTVEVQEPPLVEATRAAQDTATSTPTEAVKKPTIALTPTTRPEATKATATSEPTAAKPTIEATAAKAPEILELRPNKSLVGDIVLDGKDFGAILVANVESKKDAKDFFVYVHFRLRENSNTIRKFFVTFEQQADGSFASKAGKYDNQEFSIKLNAFKTGDKKITGKLTEYGFNKTYDLSLDLSTGSLTEAIKEVRRNGEMMPAGAPISDNDVAKLLSDYGIVTPK